MHITRTIALHCLLAGLLVVLMAPQLVMLRHALGGERAPIFVEQPQVLWGWIRTTLALGGMVVAFCLVVGYGAAWLVTRCEFPFRRTLSVLLCLPFAIPGYLYAGIAVQASHKGLLPSVENIWGAALILGLTLYPWVYLPAKALLAQQSAHYHDLARTLGLSGWRRFTSIHLGLASPVLIVTGLLVFMAVINDLGTVTNLGVKTLGLGIRDATVAMRRPEWAAQTAIIGMVLPALAVVVLTLTKVWRPAYQPANRPLPPARLQLHPALRWGLVAALALVLAGALGFPVTMLVIWTIQLIHLLDLGDLPGQIWDTTVVAAAVTAITVLIAFCGQLVLRRGRGLGMWRRLGWLVGMNYALPGIMIALTMLHLATDFTLSNTPTLIILGGSLLCLAFPWFTIRAGLDQLPHDIDDLATSLGITGPRRWWRIDLPLLRRSLAVGAFLVLITMAKELPISQTLQPFGFRSLSLRIFNFSGVGMFEGCGAYALTLIAICIYPIVALDRMIMRASNADL